MGPDETIVELPACPQIVNMLIMAMLSLVHTAGVIVGSADPVFRRRLMRLLMALLIRPFISLGVLPFPTISLMHLHTRNWAR